MILWRGTKEKIECFGQDSTGADREIFIESNLVPGKYVLFIELESPVNYASPLVLTAYSSKPVRLDPSSVKVVSHPEKISLLEQAALSVTENSKIKLRCHKYEEDPRITKTIVNIGGYLGFIYHNRSDSLALSEFAEIEAENLDYLFRKSNSYEVNLEPNSVRCVFYKITGNGKFSYKQKVVYKITKFLNIAEVIR